MKLNICTWAFQLLKVSIVLHNQAFHQIYGRIGIERFPKKLGVVCHGCVSQRHGPPPNLLTSILLSKYGAAHPSWFLFNCALPKLYKFTRFLDLRAFAGFCGRFADFCGRFAGNFGRSYVHLYALVLGIWMLGIWEWPGPELPRASLTGHLDKVPV